MQLPDTQIRFVFLDKSDVTSTTHTKNELFKPLYTSHDRPFTWDTPFDRSTMNNYSLTPSQVNELNLSSDSNTYSECFSVQKNQETPPGTDFDQFYILMKKSMKKLNSIKNNILNSKQINKFEVPGDGSKGQNITPFIQLSKKHNPPKNKQQIQNVSRLKHKRNTIIRRRLFKKR